MDTQDIRKDYGEIRTNSLGDLDGRIVANVTHTGRHGQTRLISARLAKEAERKAYTEFARNLRADAVPVGNLIPPASAQKP